MYRLTFSLLNVLLLLLLVSVELARLIPVPYSNQQNYLLSDENYNVKNFNLVDTSLIIIFVQQFNKWPKTIINNINTNSKDENDKDHNLSIPTKAKHVVKDLERANQMIEQQENDLKELRKELHSIQIKSINRNQIIVYDWVNDYFYVT